MEILGITTTTDSEETALSMARVLIHERIAACVQVDGPVRSFFRWQGKIEETNEWRVFAKTNSAQVEATISRIRELHNYDVPSILVETRKSANVDYSKWIDDSVGIS